MKNILLATILFISFTNAKAQHTLAYNQSILIDNTGGTVPYGAVWKVVSLLPSSLPLTAYTAYYNPPSVGTFAITVNSNPIYASSVGAAFGFSSDNYSATNSNGLVLPIWLPAGTTLAASTNIKYVSVIEFLVQ